MIDERSVEKSSGVVDEIQCNWTLICRRNAGILSPLNEADVNVPRHRKFGRYPVWPRIPTVLCWPDYFSAIPRLMGSKEDTVQSSLLVDKLVGEMRWTSTSSGFPQRGICSGDTIDMSRSPRYTSISTNSSISICQSSSH